MNRIRWYGPTVALLLVVLGVMILGPGVARRIAWAQNDEHIRLVQEGLTSDNALAELSNAFRKVGQVVSPSVVSIERYSKAPQGRNPMDLFRRRFNLPPGDDEGMEPQAPADPGMQQYDAPRWDGSGSGWVYNDKGHIITNLHVVQGADQIKVKFIDGSEREAKLLGGDIHTDIAVLAIAPGNLHPATIAKNVVERGDIVFAFGSPLHFEFTMSQGIVSAKGRQLHIVANGSGYENFIQTDAAINPGNSGGPLVNIYGQVVGMNTAIATRTGVFNGLGFAIPADMITKVANDIIAHGKVSRGYLGIAIRELDPKMARTFGFEGKGVLVDKAMEGTPAQAAGVQRGDIIVKLNGKPIESVDNLRASVADMAPGTKVTVEFFRKGKTITKEIPLAQLPENTLAQGGEGLPGPADEQPQPSNETLRKLGIESAMTFTPQIAEQLGIKHVPGVIVRTVRPESVAAAQMIGPRSVITAVMDVPVKNLQELAAELAKHDLTKGVRVSVLEHVGNQDLERYVLLELPKS